MQKRKLIPLIFVAALAVTLLVAALPDQQAFIRLAYADSTTEDEYGNHIVMIELDQWIDEEMVFTQRAHSNYPAYTEYEEDEQIGLTPLVPTYLRCVVAINDTLVTDGDDAYAKTRVILTVEGASGLDGTMGVWEGGANHIDDFWHVYYQTVWEDGPSLSTTYNVTFIYSVLVIT